MRGCTWPETRFGGFQLDRSILVLWLAGVELFAKESYEMNQRAHEHSAIIALCDLDGWAVVSSIVVRFRVSLWRKFFRMSVHIRKHRNLGVKVDETGQDRA